MSWLGTVKKWWGGDKESAVAEVARGVSHGEALGGLVEFGGGDGQKALSDQLSVDANLMLRYADYENMDDYPTLTAALDVYADDATIPDSIHGKTVWAKSKDKIVRDIINDLLQRRIRIEDDVWPAVRTMCKYGNLYAENLVTKVGVVGLNWLPPPTMRRLVNNRGALLGYVQDVSGSFDFRIGDVDCVEDARKDEKYEHLIFFLPWEVTHWRIRSKRMRSLYGYSVLDGARWIWKRLVMLEDTALVYKLTRSPSRYAFYIDTGDLPPKQAMALVNKVRRRYKKKKVVDPTTGKLDFKYNPLTPDEDFFVPTRGGKESTRIEVIAGPDYQSTDDINYFENKLLSAIRIPRSYLGVESEAQRAQLAQEDVRFARTEMRIQREFKNGLKHVVRLHLAALNIDPDSVTWDIDMTVPSSIFELQQIEVLNAQAALASTMSEWYPKPWILERVFHHTADDAAFITSEKSGEEEGDAKRSAGTQADIMNMYPEVAGVEGGGEEPAVESVKETGQLKKLLELAEENAEETSRIAGRLKKIEPKVTFMNHRSRMEIAKAI